MPKGRRPLPKQANKLTFYFKPQNKKNDTILLDENEKEQYEKFVIDYDDILHLNLEEDNSEYAPERIPIPTYQGRVRGINGPRDNGSYNGCVLIAALVVLKHLLSSSLIQNGDFVYIIDTHCAQLLEGLRSAQGVTPGSGFLIQSETNDEILPDVRNIAGTSGVGGNVFDPIELMRLLCLLDQTHRKDNRAGATLLFAGRHAISIIKYRKAGERWNTLEVFDSLEFRSTGTSSRTRFSGPRALEALAAYIQNYAEKYIVNGIRNVAFESFVYEAKEDGGSDSTLRTAGETGNGLNVALSDARPRLVSVDDEMNGVSATRVDQDIPRLDVPPVALPIPHPTATRIPDVEKIPYEDPRTFEFNRKTMRMHERGAEYEDVPEPVVNMSDVEDFRTYCREKSESGGRFEKRKVPVGVVYHLLDIGYLRIAPRNLQGKIAAKGKTKKKEEFFVKMAQNIGFVPLPEDFRTPGLHGILDDEGRHVVVTTANQIMYPVVYIVGKDGFLISCHRSWTNKQRAVAHLNNGTGIELGRRTYWVSGRPLTSYFLVTFELLNSGENQDGYRVSLLVSELCCRQTYKIYLAPAFLATWVEARPGSEYVAHHRGARHHNTLELLEWITHRDNCLPENCVENAERDRTESVENLPIYLQAHQAENWLLHEVLGLKIAPDGSHCLNIATGAMLTITILKYKPAKPTQKGRTEVTVKHRGIKRDFARIILEAKLGRELADDEECDHEDQERDNFHPDNLRPLTKVGNANNTSRTTKYNEDGETRNVYFIEEKDYVMAQWRDYSRYKTFGMITDEYAYFPLDKYGGSVEAATRAAEGRLEIEQEKNATFREGLETERAQNAADMVASGQLRSWMAPAAAEPEAEEPVAAEFELAEPEAAHQQAEGSPKKRRRIVSEDVDSSDSEVEFDWKPSDDDL